MFYGSRYSCYYQIKSFRRTLLSSESRFGSSLKISNSLLLMFRNCTNKIHRFYHFQFNSKYSFRIWKISLFTMKWYMSWENLSLMCAAGAAGVTDSAGGLFSFQIFIYLPGAFSQHWSAHTDEKKNYAWCVITNDFHLGWFATENLFP